MFRTALLGIALLGIPFAAASADVLGDYAKVIGWVRGHRDGLVALGPRIAATRTFLAGRPDLRRDQTVLAALAAEQEAALASTSNLYSRHSRRHSDFLRQFRSAGSEVVKRVLERRVSKAREELVLAFRRVKAAVPNLGTRLGSLQERIGFDPDAAPAPGAMLRMPARADLLARGKRATKAVLASRPSGSARRAAVMKLPRPKKPEVGRPADFAAFERYLRRVEAYRENERKEGPEIARTLAWVARGLASRTLGTERETIFRSAERQLKLLERNRKGAEAWAGRLARSGRATMKQLVADHDGAPDAVRRRRATTRVRQAHDRLRREYSRRLAGQTRTSTAHAGIRERVAYDPAEGFRARTASGGSSPPPAARRPVIRLPKKR